MGSEREFVCDVFKVEYSWRHLCGSCCVAPTVTPYNILLILFFLSTFILFCKSKMFFMIVTAKTQDLTEESFWVRSFNQDGSLCLSLLTFLAVSITLVQAVPRIMDLSQEQSNDSITWPCYEITLHNCSQDLRHTKTNWTKRTLLTF